MYVNFDRNLFHCLQIFILASVFECGIRGSLAALDLLFTNLMFFAVCVVDEKGIFCGKISEHAPELTAESFRMDYLRVGNATYHQLQ